MTEKQSRSEWVGEEQLLHHLNAEGSTAGKLRIVGARVACALEADEVGVLGACAGAACA